MIFSVNSFAADFLALSARFLGVKIWKQAIPLTFVNTATIIANGTEGVLSTLVANGTGTVSTVVANGSERVKVFSEWCSLVYIWLAVVNKMQLSLNSCRVQRWWIDNRNGCRLNWKMRYAASLISFARSPYEFIFWTTTHRFLSHVSTLTRDIDIAIQSVCPLRSSIRRKRLNISFFHHTVAQSF